MKKQMELQISLKIGIKLKYLSEWINVTKLTERSAYNKKLKTKVTAYVSEICYNFHFPYHFYSFEI